MKNFAEYHNLKESLDDDLRDKLSEEYKSWKRGCLSMIEKSIDDPSQLVNVQNFISDYLEENSEITVDNFIEDTQIFDAYLKYQTDIDELLNDKDYYDDVPSQNNIFSLYDYVIEGTKKAFKLALQMIYDEIFK